MCVNAKHLAALAVNVNMIPGMCQNTTKLLGVKPYLAMCMCKELVLPVKKHTIHLTDLLSLHAITVSTIKTCLLS